MDRNKCTPIPVCSSACPANARCKMVQGTAQCQCKAGFKMDRNKCTPICSPACPDNAQCKLVQGTPQCQCNTGFKMDKKRGGHPPVELGLRAAVPPEAIGGNLVIDVNLLGQLTSHVRHGELVIAPVKRFANAAGEKGPFDEVGEHHLPGVGNPPEDHLRWWLPNVACTTQNRWGK
ncbi:unnamed protein product [Closterium sp. NIES-53]